MTDTELRTLVETLRALDQWRESSIESTAARQHWLLEAGNLMLSRLPEILSLAERLVAVEKERDERADFISLLVHYLDGDSDERNDWDLLDDRWKDLARESAKARAKLAAVEGERDELRKALDKIANPLPFLNDEATREGRTLDGQMTVRLIDSPSWLRGIAAAALETRPAQDPPHAK